MCRAPSGGTLAQRIAHNRRWSNESRWRPAALLSGGWRLVLCGRFSFGETGGPWRLVSPGLAAGALTMPGLLSSCYPRHWLAMLVEMMSVELSWSEVMHRHSTRYHDNGHRSAFQVELCV